MYCELIKCSCSQKLKCGWGFAPAPGPTGGPISPPRPSRTLPPAFVNIFITPPPPPLTQIPGSAPNRSLILKWTLCDKRHVPSKNHSGCLETLCHVCGPLRNKMATLALGVIPSRLDSDPLADPVPGQTMLPTVSLTVSDIPGAF